jgi:hypothetical protein
MNEAAALPSPRVVLSRRLDRYYGRLRRPPGSRSTSRLNTGYRTRHFRQHQHRRPPGRGGPPQFPPPPSERSAPSTPRSSSGLRFQALHPFHGLRRERRDSALPSPHPKGQAAITTRQASLDATDRSVAPPNGALDAGLRPGPFPDRAASLLPGLLAATRTGLTPAGDDELMSDQVKSNDHLRLWAHSLLRCKFGSRWWSV